MKMKRSVRYLLVLPPMLVGGLALVLCHAGRREAAMPQIPCAVEEERLSYLAQKGWHGELLGSRAVIVPDVQDAVFSDYAALQVQQHLPLAGYAGKRAVEYTYRLEEEPLYAQLLCADGILIGAACYTPGEGDLLTIGAVPFT